MTNGLPNGLPDGSSAFTTLEKLWAERSRRSQALHGRFLEMRQTGLTQMESLLSQQIISLNPAGQGQSASAPVRVEPPAIYNRRQLESFASGSLVDCFGPEYQIFEGRRVPRIPSGELQLMDRVIEIEGRRRDFNVPARIVTEYDVPADAWFLRDSTYAGTPYSVLMEMALQPCGLLSAHLGTMWSFPTGLQAEPRLFRNLDGQANLLSTPDLRGRTVTAHANLLTHVASGVTVIQKFAFELSCEGQAFYRGESTFGYFSVPAMQSQAGLDRGAAVLPWIQANPTAGAARAGVPARAGSYLDLLEDIRIVPGGGRFAQGYAFASRAVHPADWFYRCHFLGDPVMPGSLGVEAMFQALQALARGSDRGSAGSQAALVAGQPMSWKYRGQITPAHGQMSLEVHLRSLETRAGRTLLSADASLWVDSLRIYEVNNLALEV